MPIIVGFFIVSMVSYGAGPTGDSVSARLIALQDSIVPGSPTKIGVLFTIQRGWHIYWRDSGEAGLPTKIELEYPVGIKQGPWQWPAPELFTDPGGTTTFGYENATLIMQEIFPETRLNAKKVKFQGMIRWLACNTTCVPGSAKVELDLPVRKSTQYINKELFDTYILRLPVFAETLRNWRITSQWEKGTNQIDIRVQPPATVQIERLDFFPFAPRSRIFKRNSLHAFSPNLRLVLKESLEEDVKAVEGVLRVRYKDGTRFIAIRVPAK